MFQAATSPRFPRDATFAAYCRYGESGLILNSAACSGTAPTSVSSNMPTATAPRKSIRIVAPQTSPAVTHSDSGDTCRLGEPLRDRVNRHLVSDALQRGIMRHRLQPLLRKPVR